MFADILKGRHDPQEEDSYGGGGGRFANNEDPDDHSPRVESQCNKTGQGCSGHRGGGHGGGGNAGDTCRDRRCDWPLAVMSGPGGIILWVIGFGGCELN
jgi:hypothetical protein